MKLKGFFILILISQFPRSYISAQQPDSLRRLKATVCNDSVIPLAWTHIINLNSGRGTSSNADGYFSLNASEEDTILFRNLAYEELILPARKIQPGDTIHLRNRFYAIEEVKIFEWGSTYADFKAKMKAMPVTESLARKLGLPQETGHSLPNYQNPDVLSNPLFAITNPVDFIYFNLSKKQQSVRRVNEFKRNEEQIRRFESVYNRSGIGKLTGLSGKELDDFMIYLNLHFTCDFRCTEIQIITEIFNRWRDYGK